MCQCFSITCGQTTASLSSAIQHSRPVVRIREAGRKSRKVPGLAVKFPPYGLVQDISEILRNPRECRNFLTNLNYNLLKILFLYLITPSPPPFCFLPKDFSGLFQGTVSLVTSSRRPLPPTGCPKGAPLLVVAFPTMAQRSHPQSV